MILYISIAIFSVHDQALHRIDTQTQIYLLVLGPIEFRTLPFYRDLRDDGSHIISHRIEIQENSVR